LQIDFGPRFQLGNMAAGMWAQILSRLVDPHLASALMAGAGDVVSAEHGYRLYEIAAAPDRPAAMRAFLEEFGHRSVYEAEVANPRWREDASFLEAQVAQIAASGSTGRAPRDLAAERRREAERRLAQLPLVRRAAVRWIAGQARAAAARREAGKSALIAIAEPVRYLLLEVGRRMVSAGVLDAVEDVFHLGRADLEAFIRTEWDGSGARALVADRRSLREARLMAPPPPDLISSDETVRNVAPSSAIHGGATLAGIAASSGVASGAARLIRHPFEAARLQPGDVLVAPSTDTGWTPLFLRAAAIVTEVGGYLSHGAIVAREFGLPAVVNVPGVMSELRDGETITVDGDTGKIRRER
jgi:phosphohistidine swiveling domain-containing protein